MFSPPEQTNLQHVVGTPATTIVQKPRNPAAPTQGNGPGQSSSAHLNGSSFQTIDPLNMNVHSQTFNPRSKEKSKRGCLTCKFRKKKCDEVKPVCRDCRRFDKECVWADYETMTTKEIKALRLRVEQQESAKKMRKRKRRDEDATESSEAPFKNDNINGGPEKKQPKIRQPDTANGQVATPTEPKPELRKAPIGPSPEYIEKLKSAYPTTLQLRSHFDQHHLHQFPKILSHGNENNISLHDCANTEYDAINENSRHHNLVNRSDSLAAFTVPISLPGLRDRPDLPNVFNGSPRHISPPPLDLEYYREPSDINPGSPAALMNFFKEFTQYNNGKSSPKVTEIADNDNKDIVASNEKLLLVTSPGLSPEVKISPNFNIPDFLEHVLTLSQTSPADLNHLASSFNAAFATAPQPPLSMLPGLDATGNYLYNYYVDTLSRKVCIAPHSQNESNSYQKVFLPLAQKDKGVLYGILAWSGFHLGGAWLAEGSKYAEMAVMHLRKGVDFNDFSAIKHDRRAILNKLATILILCGAEICRGDVKYWSVYLEWGWKLLRDNGGILNFDKNKEEHWLISNFAYHDLLASSTSERGTYFPIGTYLRIFADPEGVSKGNLNPLLGVCKNLFKVIGDINSLAYESQRTLETYYNRGSPISPHVSPSSHNFHSPEHVPLYLTAFDDVDSDMSEHGRTSRLLLSIIERAKALEHAIDVSKPDSDDLVDLSDSDLELQLTTFEAFQLSCKLYLRQSIMKCNPSSLESQVLVNDLVKCIDILIDSPMQAMLVFPIFIAGIHMVTEDDKVTMRLRTQKMMDMYGPWNVVRVKYLMEQVWEVNPNGDRVVDWHAILKELGWEINFA